MMVILRLLAASVLVDHDWPAATFPVMRCLNLNPCSLLSEIRRNGFTE